MHYFSVLLDRYWCNLLFFFGKATNCSPTVTYKSGLYIIGNISTTCITIILWPFTCHILVFLVVFFRHQIEEPLISFWILLKAQWLWKYSASSRILNAISSSVTIFRYSRQQQQVSQCFQLKKVQILPTITKQLFLFHFTTCYYGIHYFWKNVQHGFRIFVFNSLCVVSG